MISYTVVVGNDGPDNATGVVVTEILPNGLVYVSDMLWIAFVGKVRPR